MQIDLNKKTVSFVLVVFFLGFILCLMTEHTYLNRFMAMLEEMVRGASRGMGNVGG